MAIVWKEFGDGKSPQTAVTSLYHFHTPEMDCYVEKDKSGESWHWSLYMKGPDGMKADVLGTGKDAADAKRKATKMIKAFWSIIIK